MENYTLIDFFFISKTQKVQIFQLIENLNQAIKG